MRFRARLLFSFCLLLAAERLQAGPYEVFQKEDARDAFAKGAHEFQDVTGAFFFFDTTVNDRPAVDYAVNSARWGVMLYDPSGPGVLRGNFEFLGELFGGGIFDGPGEVLGGGTLMLRYNFVQPGARLIPYAQIGAGLVYTNIGERESRGLVSLPVEFNLQATLGNRFMINSRWSFVTEVTYRHISNATIKLPNYGIDALGGSLGFGFAF